MKFNIADTIAAICTPVGQSGLGIVRLSGNNAVDIISKIFKPSKDIDLSKNSKSHTIHHGWILDGNQIIDEVMVAIMRNPKTYTGEDIVEISAHGNMVILNKILLLLIQNGARPAAPGEFTFRAFTNGKMDLSRAEAVADLIASKTELAANASINQLCGKLSNEINGWRKEVIDLVSHLEVALDYSEEDIKFLSKEQINSSISRLSEKIKMLVDTSSKTNIIKHGLSIAIIGKPNVGKSSLLNALIRKDKAIVTDIPGTTRDIIEEFIDCKGIPIIIMDTAGLREHTLDPVEKIGQEKTINCIKSSDLILWVIDASQPLSDADYHISNLIKSLKANEKVIVVCNKIDCTIALSYEDTKDFSSTQINISALTNKGLDKLEDAILSFSQINDLEFDELILTNIRHTQALNNAHKSLNDAIISCNNNETEELIAFHLNEALNFMGEITGETTSEEILENIFANFCVGK